MSFYGSSFEPAAIDRALKRDGGSPGMSPYGTFDAVIGTFTSHLEKSPYFLGDRFSAVDVLWGSALGWMIGFKIVPATPTLQSYVERVTSRPSFTKVNASDAELVAGYEAAAQGLKSTPGI